MDRYGQILVVDAGTVGAGGVYGVGQEAVGVAQLHLSRGRALPRAVDLMKVEPLSGAASAERAVPDAPQACERELVRCYDGDGRCAALSRAGRAGTRGSHERPRSDRRPSRQSRP